jgi:hypothetical protein
LPQETNRLGPAESAALDRLLRGRAFYGQRPARQRQAEIGAYMHPMESVTPQGHVVLRWTGRLRGRSGRIADLIMGAAWTRGGDTPLCPRFQRRGVSRALTWLSAITQRPSTLRISLVLIPSWGRPPPSSR